MKRFPMMKGIASIDWATAEAIYEVYKAVYPGSAAGQSLERIAERGGFGWAEVEFLCAEYKKLYRLPLPVPLSISKVQTSSNTD